MPAASRSSATGSRRPGPLDVRASRAVHHHLGDVGVREQRLERPESGDLVGELDDESLEARRGEQRLLVAEQLGDRVAHRRLAARTRDLREARRAEEPRVDALLQVVAHASTPDRSPSSCDSHEQARHRAGERVGEARREDAGVDGASDLRPHRRRARAPGGRARRTTSAAPSERPGSSTSTTPAARASSGLCTARRRPR